MIFNYRSRDRDEEFEVEDMYLRKEDDPYVKKKEKRKEWRAIRLEEFDKELSKPMECEEIKVLKEISKTLKHISDILKLNTKWD